MFILALALLILSGIMAYRYGWNAGIFFLLLDWFFCWVWKDDESGKK